MSSNHFHIACDELARFTCGQSLLKKQRSPQSHNHLFAVAREAFHQLPEHWHKKTTSNSGGNYHGRKLQMSMSVTPSDHRAQYKLRSLVRRLMRAT
jgi:hypothetical protein